MFIPLLSAFVVFSFDKPRIALRFSGLVAIAQIVATAIVPPATTVMLTERDVPKKDFPSVVHILLDGHAGIATIPERAVDSDDVKRLVDTYVSRGFTVFRRAYSADKYTQLSIARLFNPPRESLPLEQNPKTRTFSLQSAKILEEISRKRSPDLTYSTYMQLTPAIRNLPNVSRLHMTRAFGGVTTPEFSNMPLADRLWSAAAMVRAWFIKKAESPLVAVFFKFTDFGQYWNAEFKPASWSNPLLARALFQKLIQRLECCGERGSYIFAHLIYPHHPFIFDEACQVRPSRQWVDALNHHAWQPDTIETWKVRWKRHFEQAYCAATDVAHLVDTTSQRDELADATIIVHSDHGARVRIRDYEEQNVEGYDAEDDERALRGAFLAVRIPGVLQGAVIETPVRVDEVYRQLAKQDFRNLDLTAFMPGPDSPYTDWEPSSSIALEGH